MINTESHFCAYNNLRSAKSVWRDSKQRLSWILYGQMDTEMVDKGVGGLCASVLWGSCMFIYECLHNS